MTDQGYREIQLGGKQLVFLFMASLVLAVAIFLLGVSVGRGVREAGVNADATSAPTDQTASSEQTVRPEDMPPATVVTPQDSEYHGQLQETATPPPSAPPQPAAAAKATPEPPAPAPDAPPVNPASAEPTRARAPAPATAPPAVPAPTTVARGGGNWVAQVGVFGSKTNADRLVTQLQAKGFTAYAEPASGATSRVVVGPFSDRAAADQAAGRLRAEGFQPLVRR